jgi:hypothetical protein
MSPSLLALVRWTAQATVIAGALAALGCGDDDTGDEDMCVEESDHTHGPGGCGLQENCTDTVDLEEGLRVESEDGAFTVEVLSHEPLSVEDNDIVIAIENADGDRIDDAELDVDVFSVDCMHGGPNAPDAVSAESDGSYVLSPVHAHGGPWDTVIEISAGGETDTARLHFCVPGEEHGDAGAAEAEHCH